MIHVAKHRQRTSLLPEKGVHQASELFLFVYRYIAILKIKINRQI